MGTESNENAIAVVYTVDGDVVVRVPNNADVDDLLLAAATLVRVSGNSIGLDLAIEKVNDIIMNELRAK